MGNLRVTTNDSVNVQKKQQSQQPKQAQKESVMMKPGLVIKSQN